MRETRDAILISLNDAPRSMIDALAEEQPSIECLECPVVLVCTPLGYVKLPPEGCSNCFGLGYVYVQCLT